MARKKQASVAASAAMVVTQAAPAIAAAGVRGGGSNVAQASPANRAIAPGAPAGTLRLGSTGPDVVRVQGALGIQPDGVFGPQTDQAVRIFQQRNGLAVDGIVGPRTWSVLFGPTGASFERSTPRFGFTIQRASQAESAHVKPAISGRGPVAKIVVRSVPGAEKDAIAAPQPRDDQSGDGDGGGRDNQSVGGGESQGGNGDNGGGGGGRTEPVSATTPENDTEPSSGSGGSAPAPAPAAPIGNFSCGSNRLIAPVRNYIVTGQFGEQRPGHRHSGIDLAVRYGTPIMAAACGVVVQAGSESGYGNIICVRHSPELTTCYAHMSRFAAHVGQRVHQGEVIGYVGCTGNCTGPHVHFEVRVHGAPTNPAPYLSGARRAKPTAVHPAARTSRARTTTTVRTARTTTQSSARVHTAQVTPSSQPGSVTHAQTQAAPVQQEAPAEQQAAPAPVAQTQAAPAPAEQPAPAPQPAPSAPAQTHVQASTPAPSQQPAPQAEQPAAPAEQSAPAEAPAEQAPAPQQQAGPQQQSQPEPQQQAAPPAPQPEPAQQPHAAPEQQSAAPAADSGAPAGQAEQAAPAQAEQQSAPAQPAPAAAPAGSN